MLPTVNANIRRIDVDNSRLRLRYGLRKLPRQDRQDRAARLIFSADIVSAGEKACAK